MTTELILLLAIYLLLIVGVFFGELGPIETFHRSAPRLGAQIERDISIGHEFQSPRANKGVRWVE